MNAKSTVFRTLRRAGVEKAVRRGIRRLPGALGDPLEASVVRAKVRLGHRLVPEDAIQAAYVRALDFLGTDGRIPGDYLEFGVYTGSSMASMWRALERHGDRDVRLFGFDSFEGLPVEADDDPGAEVWAAGDFRSPEATTRWYLQREGVPSERVHLVKGWFDETLTEETAHDHGIDRAGIILVDCDLYSSARSALEFCAPLIGDRAVVFFDDWNSDDLAARDAGEKRAFDEFLAAHPAVHARPFDGRYRPEAAAFVLERRR
jgi:O-methyltransferase